MDLEQRVRQHFQASIEAKQAAIHLAPAIVRAARTMSGCLRGDGKILACGNGGSAADAQHIAGEFTGRLRRDRPALPAIALTANPSDLTAIGNDYGFEQVFSQAHYLLEENGTTVIEQLIEAGVQVGWNTRIVPFGPDISSAVFALGFANRAVAGH